MNRLTFGALVVDGAGSVTTGLMSAERWVKDNRLLPDGFDRAGADPRVMVQGAAASDRSFLAGGDYESFETARFLRYYESMAEVSALVVAEAERTGR